MFNNDLYDVSDYGNQRRHVHLKSWSVNSNGKQQIEDKHLVL